MAIYAAYVPADQDVDRVVLVRDGYSVAALVFGPFWLLAHRLWLGLLGWIAVVAGLVGLSYATSVNAGGLVLLFALWFGLEANALRRLTLTRAGLRLEGLVEAGDRDAAERRFFSEWRTPRTDVRPPAPAGRVVPREAGVIGLFPEIGVR